MPKSRQRKRERTALEDAKNLARGTRDPIEAISRARAAIDVLGIPELGAWVEKAYARTDIVAGLKPAQLSALQPPTVVEETSLLKELVWAAAMFERHARSLKTYLIVREEISLALLRGDFSSALTALDKLNSEAGYSLFSISIRLALKQLEIGLDQQKEYVSEIRADGASHNLNFFAYWWSIRAEPGASAEDFVNSILSRSEKWHVTDGLKALLLFHLIRAPPAPDHEAALIASAMSTSLVDYYEAIISTAISSVSEARESSAAFAAFAVSASQFLPDPRLSKIRYLAGDRDGLGALKSTSRNWWLAASGQAAPDTSWPIESMEDVAASAVADGCPAAMESDVAKYVWEAMRALLGPSPAADCRPTEISRIGLMLAGTVLGDWCWALKAEQWMQTASYDRALAVKRFLAVPEIGPMVLPHLRKDEFDPLWSKLEADGWRHEDLEHEGPLPANARLAARAKLEVMLRAEGVGQNPQQHAAKLAAAQELRSLGYNYRRSLAAEIEALLGLERLDEALAIFCSAGLESGVDPLGLPTATMQAALTPEAVTQHARNIHVAIALDIIVRAGAIEAAPFRFYAVEDYLAANGADRPIALRIEHLNVAPGDLVYFLSEVCTPNILSLSIAFGTQAELQDERLSICRLLSQLDPEHTEKYEQEARDILRARLVAAALEDVQRTKIAMDETALSQWAGRALKRDYDRYSALLSTGVVAVNDEFRTQLYAAVEAGTFQEAHLDVPENEASALFAALVHRFMHECALSQEHGLDSYLSVRIRHGTISGAVRGPVEAEHLVTRKAVGSTFYRRNEHWDQRLSGNVTVFQMECVQDLLSEFSARIDSRISTLVEDFIQIKRPERQKGLFNLTLSKFSVFAFANEIKEDTTFEHFVARAFDYFWALVDEGLTECRSYITGDFKQQVWGDFSELEQALTRNIDGDSLAAIRDGVLRARTDMMHTLDRMADWFTMPTPIAKLPMDLSMLVDLAVATLRNFYPDFAPRVDVKAEGLPQLVGVHSLFADVFFILFENIMLRSGHDGDPDVSVVAVQDGSWLTIRIENCVAEDADHLDRIEAGIAGAEEKIASGAYRTAVRREGGSGFPKLMKLLQIDPTDERFFFRLDRTRKKFQVQFPLKVLEIAQ